MSQTDNRNNQEKCVVCGTTDRPEKGWIYRSTDVVPDELTNDGLKFKAKPDADPFCSTDCLHEYKSCGESDE